MKVSGGSACWIRGGGTSYYSRNREFVQQGKGSDWETQNRETSSSECYTKSGATKIAELGGRNRVSASLIHI